MHRIASLNRVYSSFFISHRVLSFFQRSGMFRPAYANFNYFSTRSGQRTGRSSAPKPVDSKGNSLLRSDPKRFTTHACYQLSYLVGFRPMIRIFYLITPQRNHTRSKKKSNEFLLLIIIYKNKPTGHDVGNLPAWTVAVASWRSWNAGMFCFFLI